MTILQELGLFDFQDKGICFKSILDSSQSSNYFKD